MLVAYSLEDLECPTLLYNGYGEHNIQGIGDKHLPLIHNAQNTDYVIGVSDQASDALNLLFNTTTGRSFLANRKGLNQDSIFALADLGLSSIANILAAIKLAKYMKLGSDDAILTVATDGAEMYGTELDKTIRSKFSGDFDEVEAAETFGQHLAGDQGPHANLDGGHVGLLAVDRDRGIVIHHVGLLANRDLAAIDAGHHRQAGGCTLEGFDASTSSS